MSDTQSHDDRDGGGAVGDDGGTGAGDEGDIGAGDDGGMGAGNHGEIDVGIDAGGAGGAAAPEDERAVEIADRVHSAAIHVLRFLRTEDEALGLSAPKLSALSVLVFRGPLTVSELARAEQVTPATTSRLVTELESSGLARREVDDADGRVRRVTPTPRGVELLHEGRRRRVARLAAEVSALAEGERDTIAEAAGILERIVSGRR